MTNQSSSPLFNNLVRPANPCKPNDGFVLKSAHTRHGPVRIWDCGYGTLWACWDTCGNFSHVIGLVRAVSWEEAWQAAIDEVFADPDPGEEAEYNKVCEAAGESGDFPGLPEGWHFRGSGRPSNSDLKSNFAEVSLDINNPVGRATMDILRDARISIVWETQVTSWGRLRGERYFQSTVDYHVA